MHIRSHVRRPGFFHTRLRGAAVCLGWLWLLGGLIASLQPCQAAAPPRIVQIPSQRPSGNAINDTIWIRFYPAVTASQTAPGIVLLHPIGEASGDFLDHFMHRLAGMFAARGFNCALMALPYHLERRPPGAPSVGHFIGADVDRDVQALAQGSADISTVFTWLGTQPGVDPQRRGVVGISLGAILLHLAMGQDPRLTAGVALEGGGNLGDIFQHSLEVRLHVRHPVVVDERVLQKLRVVDPIAFAGRNQPRHVLMIEAARDSYVPPRAASSLWEALGHPPIQWVDTNHFAFVLTGPSFANVATSYLTRVWNGPADTDTPLPVYRPIALKAGVITGLGAILTPAVQWQAYSVGTRSDHLSLAHLDLGLSGRGPFVGVAATLTPFIDVGLARRVFDAPIRPYASLHFAF